MKPSLETILFLFDYDRNNGILFWQNAPSKNKRYLVGKEAGTTKIDGNTSYTKLFIEGKQYLLHSVIWFIETGKWPKLLDHIDGNGLNCRFKNLREASNRENQQNSHRHRKGHLAGTQWLKKYGFWKASIRVNGKAYHLGCFITAEAAHRQYLDALKLVT